MHDLHDFLEPVQLDMEGAYHFYNESQLAKHIHTYQEEFPDISQADIVLVGVGETRGNAFPADTSSPDNIRRQLYPLYYWHRDIRLADIGNVRTGATLSDSYAAAKTVIAELLRLNKTVVILGGSHDVTLAQYLAYKELGRIIEATCIDAAINLMPDSSVRSDNFLLEMLTSEPNYIKHYNHIGFQSYLVNPSMLETIDKLRFDCFRLGVARNDLEEMEPVLRNSHLVSFDISAIRHSDAPANTFSPNGFTGEEACTLTRFAGMSNQVDSLGVYGYDPQRDVHSLTAKQIAQMLWYFIDGKSRSKQEAAIEDRVYFNEYETMFAEVETTFLQSKKSNRWWMQLPNKKFIACSYADYLHASRNEIPERWLRAQERS